MMRTILLLTTALALVPAPLSGRATGLAGGAWAAEIELAQATEAEAAADEQLKKKKKQEEGAAGAKEEPQTQEGMVEEQSATENAEKSGGEADEKRRKRPKADDAAGRPEQPKTQDEAVEEQPAQKAEQSGDQAGEKRRKRPQADDAAEQAEQPKTQDEAAEDQPAQEKAGQSGGQAEKKQRKRPKADEQAEQPVIQEGAAEDQSVTEQAEEPEPKATPKAESEASGEPPAQEDTAEEKADDLGETAEQPAPEKQDEAASVSEDAEQPKQLATEPIAEQIEKASEEAIAVVPDKISKQDRARLRDAEIQRRKEAKRNRAELIGAAAIGVAVGALVPMLGGKVVGDEGDRMVVERNGGLIVRKDESALLRGRDSAIEYERLNGGRVRETITRPDGTRIVTVRDAGGYVLRRMKILANGDRIILFDWREENGRRHVDYDHELPPIRLTISLEQYIVLGGHADRHLIYETFAAPPIEPVPQVFTLREVRESVRVREIVRRVDLDTITFDTGSAAVRNSQVPLLGDIAGGMLDVIERDPGAVFLIEGHTDAVGSDIYNVVLSDRRAESVARILVDAYGVPPENLVTEGYGEQYLKIDTQFAEQANRRVTVRNITPLVSSENR